MTREEIRKRAEAVTMQQIADGMNHRKIDLTANIESAMIDLWNAAIEAASKIPRNTRAVCTSSELSKASVTILMKELTDIVRSLKIEKPL